MSLNKIPSSEYIYRQFDIINSKLKTLECQIDKIDDAGFQCSDLLSCNTDKLPEGSNLYYTDARVLNYVSTLPVSTFANDVPYLTEIQADTLYYSITNPNNYIALTALSAGTGISYNNLTGVITNTAPNLPDYIQSVSDTNTVDLDVTTNILTANVRHQDSTTINLSDDASGLKADLATGAAIANLGFTPENVANKATDFTTINNTLYPSNQAVQNFYTNTYFTDLTSAVSIVIGAEVIQVGDFFLQKTGTGATGTSSASEPGRNGIFIVDTGTSATGACRLRNSSIWLSNPFVFKTSFRVSTLSTALQNFTIIAGINLSTVVSVTDYIRFFYNHATNSGNFVCECSSGGLVTTINTAVPLAINTWYDLIIVKDALGQVEFFINNVSMGAASSSNVPNNISMLIILQLLKSVGTTARDISMDYIYYQEN